jgi:hypothetical protein
MLGSFVHTVVTISVHASASIDGVLNRAKA